MARCVFFSFHYGNDVWRANVVRNSWVTKPDRQAAGFTDWVDFEKIKKGGDAAIKRWIDNQLHGTSVTVVLIGSETNKRDYVKYELQKSYSKGNGIIGIYIHSIKDKDGNICTKGEPYFGEIGHDGNGSPIYLGSFPIYDWVNDDGYANLGRWIEAAAIKAGK